MWKFPRTENKSNGTSSKKNKLTISVKPPQNSVESSQTRVHFETTAYSSWNTKAFCHVLPTIQAGCALVPKILYHIGCFSVFAPVKRAFRFTTFRATPFGTTPFTT